MKINLTVGASKNLVVSGNNLIYGHITVPVSFWVKRLNKKQLRIYWDGTADTDPKWVYVDGDLVNSTPAIDSDGNEYVTVSVPNTTTAAIEVYSSLGEPDSFEMRPEYLPIINWKSSLDAYRYFIYIDDTLIRTIVADPNKYDNKYQTVTKLSDGWHYLVVRAADKLGNTEDSVTKWFRTWTPAEPVTSIGVTAGSGAGLYDITIA